MSRERTLNEYHHNEECATRATNQIPLQLGIALERAAGAVKKLAAGNVEIDTSIEHLGTYATRMEWLRQQVLITRARP